MIIPRDKNVEVLHSRGGKGPHLNKRKDKKRLRKKLKEKLRQLIKYDEHDD